MIEGLGKQLNLDRRQVEPSFNSLYWCAQPRFPDTTSVRPKNGHAHSCAGKWPWWVHQRVGPMQSALLRLIVAATISLEAASEHRGDCLSPFAIANKWRPVMRRYGNTSSASVWYALGYIEACQGVRAGETVWQVGFVAHDQGRVQMSQSVRGWSRHELLLGIRILSMLTSSRTRVHSNSSTAGRCLAFCARYITSAQILKASWNAGRGRVAVAAGGLWQRLQVQQRGVESAAHHPRQPPRGLGAHGERQPGLRVEVPGGAPPARAQWLLLHVCVLGGIVMETLNKKS